MGKVDHNAIKFGQVVIVLTVAVAWLAGAVWLIAGLAAVLTLSVASPTFSPLRLLYRYAAVPLGIARPHLVDDEAAPHRFSQGVGALFLWGSTAALYTGGTTVGWAIGALVAVLAAVNVIWNFCAGCFIFYQLRRAGVIVRRQTV